MTSTEDLARQVLQELRTHKNVLLYGPPGCGKTFLMRKVRDLFMASGGGPLKLDEAASTDFLKEESDPESWWITFHQSYAYEDFVVGLRTQAGQGFHVEPQPGPFVEASAHASTQGGESLILIDEINRGNTSRAFGELITLMEPDKRTGAENEVHVDLPIIPHSGLTVLVPRSKKASKTATVARRFSLSPRLYVLASMNSVDRTVAPLDAALRRRFRIMQLRPDYDLLREKLGIQSADTAAILASRDENDPMYWRVLSVEVLEHLNARIGALSGNEVQLGHAYLWPLIGTSSVDKLKQTLAEVMQLQIVPQVEELYRGNDELIGAVLAAPETAVEARYPVRFEEPPATVAEIGGRKVIRYGPWGGDQMGAHLRRLAGAGNDANPA